MILATMVEVPRSALPTGPPNFLVLLSAIVFFVGVFSLGVSCIVVVLQYDFGRISLNAGLSFALIGLGLMIAPGSEHGLTSEAQATAREAFGSRASMEQVSAALNSRVPQELGGGWMLIPREKSIVMVKLDENVD